MSKKEVKKYFEIKLNKAHRFLKQSYELAERVGYTAPTVEKIKDISRQVSLVLAEIQQNEK
jgi:hypothetical protein